MKQLQSRALVVALLGIGVIATLAVGLPQSTAEVVRYGDLRASFEAELDPRVRPRHREVPVRFGLSGWVDSASGNALPQLDRLEISVHPRGRTRGSNSASKEARRSP